MSIAPFNPASYPGQPANPRAQLAWEIASDVGTLLDRDKNGSLSRDEFTGSQFAQIDRDGYGSVTLNQLRQTLEGLDEPVLQVMRDNAANARRAIEYHIPNQRGSGIAFMVIGSVGGAVATAFLRMRPWVLAPLLVPAALFLGAGAMIVNQQPAKNDRARALLSTYLNEALQNKELSPDDFSRLATPFGEKLEQTMDTIGRAIAAPFDAAADFISNLVNRFFFFLPFSR